MAESKNTFTSSKMNEDIDDRLINNDQYRSARNITIVKSEGQNVGAIENILGNRIAYLTPLDFNEGTETIGYCIDERKERVIWFVTDYSEEQDNSEFGKADDSNTCAILMYDQTTPSQDPVILVRGSFLNFSKNHLITGVNIIEDLLFWTDNLNQPRRINIQTALNSSTAYTTEQQISITRVAPITAPIILDENDIRSMTFQADGPNEVRSKFLEEKFARLSYRFKFADNEYSVMAPFSQHIFIPKTMGLADSPNDQLEMIKTTKNIKMINGINQCIMRVNLPSSYVYQDFYIKGIEILLKTSESNVVKVVDYIDLTYHIDEYDHADGSGALIKDGSVYYYTYKGNNPYKTLPETQTERIYDRVPRKAKAQEVIGNRIVYGNFKQYYNLPDITYIVISDTKDIDHWQEYPIHSVKQRRTYQVGVVLTDRFGRETPVIVSSNQQRSTTHVNQLTGQPYLNSFDVDNTPINSNYNSTLDLTDPHALNQIETWHGQQLNIVFQAPIPDSLMTKTKVDLSSYVFYGINVSNFGRTLNLICDTDISSEFNVGDLFKDTGVGYSRIVHVGVIFDGSNYHITINFDKAISHDYFADLDKGFFFRYTENNNGIWHSYKIVVKQKEQEYYNVYDYATMNFDEKSWIPLYSDNINKIYRDVTQQNRLDGTSPTKARLYSKVLCRIKDGKLWETQGDPEAPQIPVISIGTAREHKLYIQQEAITESTVSGATTTTSTIQKKDPLFQWIYETDKNHLYADISDKTEDGENSTYGINRLQHDLNIEYENPRTIIPLSVYETIPFESNLDLFWETSTSGLVEDLNYDISISPNYPYDLYIESKDGLYENLPSNEYIPGAVLHATPFVGLPSDIAWSIISVKDLDNNPRTGLFTVEKDTIDNEWKLKTTNTFIWKSGAVADFNTQTFKIKLNVIDNADPLLTPNTIEVPIQLHNIAPTLNVKEYMYLYGSFIDMAGSSKTLYADTLTDNILFKTTGTVNGSADVNTGLNLKYELTPLYGTSPTDAFVVDQYTGNVTVDLSKVTYNNNNITYSIYLKVSDGLGLVYPEMANDDRTMFVNVAKKYTIRKKSTGSVYTIQYIPCEGTYPITHDAAATFAGQPTGTPITWCAQQITVLGNGLEIIPTDPLVIAPFSEAHSQVYP